jgi:hypothetical protein
MAKAKCACGKQHGPKGHPITTSELFAITESLKASIFRVDRRVSTLEDKVRREVDFGVDFGIPASNPFGLSAMSAARERIINPPPRDPPPIPMLLSCPACHARHIDEGEFVTKIHHTHACQSCGHCWRPAIVPTIGVQFLPGFRNK